MKRSLSGRTSVAASKVPGPRAARAPGVGDTSSFGVLCDRVKVVAIARVAQDDAAARAALADLIYDAGLLLNQPEPLFPTEVAKRQRDWLDVKDHQPHSS